MPVSSKNGWGVQNFFGPVTKVSGGVNVVLSNVGAAIQVISGTGPLRLTKLAYRIDLAPDVPVGAASSPVLWRVCVVEGQLPADISAFQKQAFPTGSHPEVPQNLAYATPQPTLFDLWLDFSAGDPGLNALATWDFADAGPTVTGTDFLTVLACPILDANLSAAPLGAANALISLMAWGTGAGVSPYGAASSDSNRSLPRYDISVLANS